jgi:drug/metabolite transporter (DMT)-like permease
VVAVGLALLAALCYGTADFLAGLAARRADVMQVTLTVYVTGLVTVAAVLPWVHGGHPTVGSLIWGAVSGTGQTLGAVALNAGFRRAPFSIAGPLSAVVGAGLAVFAGLALGERLGGFAWGGVILALPAVLAVSCSDSSHRPAPTVTRSSGPLGRGGVNFGLAAGVGCAVSLIGMSRAGAASGLWPILAVQLAAFVTIAGVTSATGEFRLAMGRPRKQSIASGALGCCAAISYLLATQRGPLAVTAVLSSLFPIVTIALAVAFARERLGAIRLAGVALAAVSVSLIAFGGTG